jgi:hypothetical protein
MEGTNYQRFSRSLFRTSVCVCKSECTPRSSPTASAKDRRETSIPLSIQRGEGRALEVRNLGGRLSGTQCKFYRDVSWRANRTRKGDEAPHLAMCLDPLPQRWPATRRCRVRAPIFELLEPARLACISELELFFAVVRVSASNQRLLQAGQLLEANLMLFAIFGKRRRKNGETGTRSGSNNIARWIIGLLALAAVLCVLTHLS